MEKQPHANLDDKTNMDVDDITNNSDDPDDDDINNIFDWRTKKV